MSHTTLIDDEHRKLLEEIYYSYHNTMFYTAYHVLKDHSLSEDAVQEALLYLAKNTTQIKYGVQSDRTRKFIITLTKHRALNILKARVRTNLRTEPLYEQSGTEDVLDAAALTANRMAVEEIHAGIRELPDIYRKVIELNVLSGMAPKEISNELGLKNSLVRKRLERGKKILQDILKERGFDSYG